jgi:hypothetical protein
MFFTCVPEILDPLSWSVNLHLHKEEIFIFEMFLYVFLKFLIFYH